MTVFGEMKIRRRLYEDRVTGETRFLLDERLGLEKRDRVSAGVKEMGKALGQAPGHDPEGYEETCKALSEGDLDRVKACLKKAEERARDSKRQEVNPPPSPGVSWLLTWGPSVKATWHRGPEKTRVCG